MACSCHLSRKASNLCAAPNTPGTNRCVHGSPCGSGTRNIRTGLLCMKRHTWRLILLTMAGFPDSDRCWTSRVICHGSPVTSRRHFILTQASSQCDAPRPPTITTMHHDHHHTRTHTCHTGGGTVENSASSCCHVMRPSRSSSTALNCRTRKSKAASDSSHTYNRGLRWHGHVREYSAWHVYNIARSI
jgi:hypothetical protein